MIRPVLHDPNAIRTYGLFWGKNLSTGDSLQSATWATPAGITKVSEGVNTTAIVDPNDGQIYPAGTVALIRVSSATAGATYPCVCHIVTVNGDADDRTLEIVVQER